MEKLSKIVGPGTAGIAQRIASEKADYYTGDAEDSEDALYVVEQNEVISCGQNQF